MSPILLKNHENIISYIVLLSVNFQHISTIAPSSISKKPMPIFLKNILLASTTSNASRITGSVKILFNQIISSGPSFLVNSGIDDTSTVSILVLVIIGEYDYAANIAFASIFSTRAVSSASNIVYVGRVIIFATIFDGNISLLLLSCLTAALYPRRAP